MRGVVIIGEGEKDEAPMLFNGETVGDGTGFACDIAVDPIDGTTLTAMGRGSAIAVIAVSEPRHHVRPRAVRLHGQARGRSRGSRRHRHRRRRWPRTSHRVAEAKGEQVRDVTAVILDRPRHAELIAEVRAAGAASG